MILEVVGVTVVVVVIKYGRISFKLIKKMVPAEVGSSSALEKHGH
jgi:hypothetical protein